MQLSEAQKKATNHIDGPALVLAVPGAGKTTMLLYRTMNLIEHNINPNRILSITFSKASSLDMETRFKELFPNYLSRVKFSTIHAFCYRIILDYSKSKNFEYLLIDSNPKGKYELIKNIYSSINVIMPTEERIETILTDISFLKNSMIYPDNLKGFKSEVPKFKDIYLKYEIYKRNKNLIDFDDMILKSIEILQNNQSIRNKYINMYDYYQLDEGQDTSKAQFYLIKYLCQKHNNLFIVADDDQSIYGFRGADPSELFKLKQEYKDLKIYFMQNNYRSSKNIVNTSNLFINNNLHRFNKCITTENEFLNPVNIIKVNNNEDEYNFIEEEINKNRDKNYAVLYRNNISALGLVEFFERNNIKFNIRDSKVRFFNSFAVKDILNILKFSEDMSDVNLYETFYYKIKGYISKNHINYLKKNPGKNCLMVLMSYPGLSTRYKDNISKLIHDFKRIRKVKPDKKINIILNELEYDKYLEESAERFGSNYKILREYCYYLEYISKSEESINSLEGRLSHLEQIMQKPDYFKTNITFSTIHSVKGLEYDSVFVIDLVEGMLPSNKAIEDKSKKLLEEERRLFYVAMTRAKENLYLLSPKKHNSNKSEMSRFLAEISNY